MACMVLKAAGRAVPDVLACSCRNAGAHACQGKDDILWHFIKGRPVLHPQQQSHMRPEGLTHTHSCGTRLSQPALITHAGAPMLPWMYA